jgi:hypothetical protein
MTPVVIENGRSRIIYTPETRAIRLDRDGSGLIQTLTPRQCQELSAALLIGLVKKR